MSDANRPFDWVRFLVQFFFGALFGGLAGFYLALNFSAEKLNFWLTVSGMTLLVGLAAGFWGDQFWESFRDSLWNPFRWFF